MIRTILVWALIALQAFSGLYTIAMVGTERPRYTSAGAVASVVFGVAIIAGILYIAGWVG